jgi:hypothetical protein
LNRLIENESYHAVQMSFKMFSFHITSILYISYYFTYPQMVDCLRNNPYTDQLLTGNGWLHISWNPFRKPRHYVRIGYYK